MKRVLIVLISMLLTTPVMAQSDASPDDILEISSGTLYEIQDDTFFYHCIYEFVSGTGRNALTLTIRQKIAPWSKCPKTVRVGRTYTKWKILD